MLMKQKHQSKYNVDLMVCPVCGGENMLVGYNRGILGLFCSKDLTFICAVEVDYEFGQVIKELQLEAVESELERITKR